MRFQEAFIVKPEDGKGYPDTAVAWTNGPGDKDYEVPYLFLKGLKIPEGAQWVMYIPRDVRLKKDLPTRWGLAYNLKIWKERSVSCYRSIWEFYGPHMVPAATVLNDCVCGGLCTIPYPTDGEMVGSSPIDPWMPGVDFADKK